MAIPKVVADKVREVLKSIDGDIWICEDLVKGAHRTIAEYTSKREGYLRDRSEMVRFLEENGEPLKVDEPKSEG